MRGREREEERERERRRLSVLVKSQPRISLELGLIKMRRL